MSDNMNGPADGAHETAPIEAHMDADVDNRDRGDERATGNREAAKYRRQLREVETQRDQLNERLSAVQRPQAETLAREYLADGADMWRDGLDLAALLDDEGVLNPAKVAQAAQSARKAHPHWGAPPTPRRHPDSRRGLASGASSREDNPRPVSWAGLLNDRAGD